MGKYIKTKQIKKAGMNRNLLEKDINSFWDKYIVPSLVEYVKIPNKSPSFDPDWKKAGHMDKALDLATTWVKQHLPKNATLLVKETRGKTPVILVDVPGSISGNVLMYGHLDKQPEMDGWNKGMGPWKPVIKNNKLYGRGAADDGYALFASICSINALHKQKIDTPRVLLLIEFSEESGSPDLPHYMDLCSKEIGTPDLVICLDSGAGDYNRFWNTTSLRGLIGARLRVDVLKEGVHSGGASGYVPSSFRVARQLLSRIENETTGEILLEELKTEIPRFRKKEAEELVSTVGVEVDSEFPWVENMEPSTKDKIEGVLRKTWRPALSVVGANGSPLCENAGNVLRPYTELQLSIRIPPLVDHNKAKTSILSALTSDPPYDSKITLSFDEPASGWNAPETKSWLSKSIMSASKSIFNHPSCSIGEGGTIPFMAMLGKQFPEAQFVITGVLGPASNAHGPNEFLHIPYAKKLTACISLILKDFRR